MIGAGIEGKGIRVWLKIIVIITVEAGLVLVAVLEIIIVIFRGNGVSLIGAWDGLIVIQFGIVGKSGFRGKSEREEIITVSSVVIRFGKGRAGPQ